MKLLFFLSIIFITTSESKEDKLNLVYPEFEMIEQYALSLIMNGKIIDNNYVFSEDDLSIRRIGFIQNLKSGNNVLRVETRATCGVKFKAIHDYKPADGKGSYYVQLSFDLNQQGEITQIDPAINDISCDENRENINNDHIVKSDKVEFNHDINSVNGNNNRVINHIEKLLQENKIVYGDFVFHPNHVDLNYINYFEISEFNYNGLNVNLHVKCDIKNSGYNKNTSIREINVFMMPDGGLKYIKPIYGRNRHSSC